MRLKNSNNNRFIFTYLKGKVTDRKGMGMELALLVLLVIFGCSTLMVGSALIQRNVLQQQENEIREKLTLDQFAESILAGSTSADLDKEKFADYAAFKKEGSSLKNLLHGDDIQLPDDLDDDIVLLITDLSGKPLLSVGLYNNKITQWNYH